MTPDDVPDPLAVALDFAGILEDVRIPYLIGGSFASSVHGEPRSTNDVDMLVDMREEHVAPLGAAVSGTYYLSESAAKEAVRAASSFNAIHMAAAVKVDVFVAGGDPFDLERLRLRTGMQVTPERVLYFDRAEHSVIRKLEWYRRGGELSDRQWRDVVGILRVQGAALDVPRMETWASRLGVSDLLERAMREAT